MIGNVKVIAALSRPFLHFSTARIFQILRNSKSEYFDNYHTLLWSRNLAAYPKTKCTTMATRFICICRQTAADTNLKE
jgi:hypothetical protein